MNARQIYELVKDWKDQWPEGLEYTPCEAVNPDSGEATDMPMWTLNLDGISFDDSEGEEWKDEEDRMTDGSSILTPIAAARMLTDRACELSGCGVANTDNPEAFLLLGGLGPRVVRATSRLEAACLAMRIKREREKPDPEKCPMCGTILIHKVAYGPPVKCVNCGFDAEKKKGGNL